MRKLNHWTAYPKTLYLKQNTEFVQISEELAEIAGIHAGDGHLRKGRHNELEICGSTEEKQYYDYHVVKLFKKEFNLSLVGRFFKSKNTYGIVVRNLDVINKLLELDFPNGRKTTIVNVPKIIYSSKDVTIKRKFLRGLFDTDGCITFSNKTTNSSQLQRKYNYYPLILIQTCSKKLMEQCFFMLQDQGFNPKLYQITPKNKRDKKKYLVKLSGVLQTKKWMNEIGTKNPTKASKYNIWQIQGYYLPNSTHKERLTIINEALQAMK